MKTPAIAISNASKHYGDITAVQPLSISVSPGEIYGFLGLNGAGKTTTIRMLLGMIRPSGGKISIFGNDIRAARRITWEKVGYLVETPYSYPELTVRENLEVIRRLHLISNKQATDEIMELLSLTKYAQRKAGTLSLGNAQRLGLAKALIHKPALLILDEPTNGLDPAGIVEIRELLRSLAQEKGVTIFMSSHLLDEVARLATRIGIIHEGRLLQEIEVSELTKHEQKRVVISVKEQESVAQHALRIAGITAVINEHGQLNVSQHNVLHDPSIAARALSDAGLSILHLAVERENLEAYFLRLIGQADGLRDKTHKQGRETGAKTRKKELSS